MSVKRTGMLLICLLFAVLMLLPMAASAQQVFPSKGSLDSAEDGLWNYYKGKSRTTVKRNAPRYERLKDSSDYLLDYKKIKGVEIFLTGRFKDNKLSVLQITTPFPEYEKCNKETKDLSRGFADVAYAMMGVKFNAKKECQQLKENGGSVVCTSEDTVCVYRLCPEKSWALACSVR